MKRSLTTATLCLITGLMVSGPVVAKKEQMKNINFGTISCEVFLKELAGGSEDDAGAVLLWIDGYLSGVSGDTELKWKDLETFSEKLVEYCGKNADAKVLEAAKKVGISK
jgi:acid stress chaperone HdeB